jgi:5-deoxy-glucuronate isomerase
MTTTRSTAHNSAIIRATDAHKGRRLSVTPQVGGLKRIRYGRIVLDQTEPRATLETGECEVALVCLAGRATVRVGQRAFELTPLDVVYLPPGTVAEVHTDDHADVAEAAAPVKGDYPLQFVPIDDVHGNDSLQFTTGGAGNTRTITILVGKNVRAGRLLVGVTRSEPGNWTSWPPHEHTSTLEEVYVYYDMPPPAFAVQLVYTDPSNPEFVGIVRQGDAVLIPSGFHPNVAIPGHPINFLWIMAAEREGVDREFGVVNLQPGFDRNGTGLEASRR